MRVIRKPSSFCSSRTRTVVCRSRGRGARLAEQVGERHREAARLGGGDQLLGVGPLLDVLDAVAQRERALDRRRCASRSARPPRARYLASWPCALRLTRTLNVADPSVGFCPAIKPLSSQDRASKEPPMTEILNATLDLGRRPRALLLAAAPALPSSTRRAAPRCPTRSATRSPGPCARRAPTSAPATPPATGSRRSSSRPRPTRPRFLGCDPHEITFGAEHDLAGLHALAHRRARLRARRRDPRLLRRPRRRRRAVAGARPRPGPRRPARRAAPGHDARLRRPGRQAVRAHARRRVRLGLQRGRHRRRRRPRLRDGARRGRAGLDRRRPLRGARADRRARDRRRRAASAPRTSSAARTSASPTAAPR